MITAGFIGCGNMGGALAKAAAKSIGGKNILLSDFVEEKAENLAEEIFAHAADNKTIAENCKYIFLGVKPQVIFDTIKEITSVLKKRKDRYVVISMAAGISIEAIEKEEQERHRKAARREQGNAQSYEELVALAKKRGYKNPAGWAYFIMRGRR